MNCLERFYRKGVCVIDNAVKTIQKKNNKCGIGNRGKTKIVVKEHFSEKGKTMEELLTECFKEDENAPNLRDFEIYKSNICHLVKDKGDIDFIIDTLKENQIRTYWERQWYRESFYLLAMVDYLSRENGLPLCNDYEDIRNCKLSEPLYPWDVVLAAKSDGSLDRKEQCLKEAIPEFLRFNIIESEIRNVC